MSQVYSIHVTWEQTRGDDVVGEVEAEIFFTVTPAGGAGWNEPRYDAQAEFDHVEHKASGGASDPFWVKAAVEEWAQDWVEKNQDACLRVYHDEAEREREYAAELRGER